MIPRSHSSIGQSLACPREKRDRNVFPRKRSIKRLGALPKLTPLPNWELSKRRCAENYRVVIVRRWRVGEALPQSSVSPHLMGHEIRQKPDCPSWIWSWQPTLGTRVDGFSVFYWEKIMWFVVTENHFLQPFLSRVTRWEKLQSFATIIIHLNFGKSNSFCALRKPSARRRIHYLRMLFLLMHSRNVKFLLEQRKI